MGNRTLSSQEISALIDHLLAEKDHPAQSGLTTILKARQARDRDYPLKSLDFDQFRVEGRSTRPLRDEEKRILELEKQVIELRDALQNQKKQAQSAISEALRRGLAEGQANGRQSALAEATKSYEQRIGEIQRSVTGTLAAVEHSRRALFDDSLHLTVRLALEAAKKIIGTELSLNGAIVASSIKRALSYIADREKLVIRVAPEETEVASKTVDFWKPVSERLGDISIIADSHVRRGGCIVESTSGVADARLGVQFEELSDLIEKAWQSIVADGEETPASQTGLTPG